MLVREVDGAAGGQRALRWAIEEAGRRGETVRAVSAWSWDGVDELDAPSTPGEAVARARRVFDTTVDEVLPGVPARPGRGAGDATRQPERRAVLAALDAGLLVPGQPCHGGVHDKLLA